MLQWTLFGSLGVPDPRLASTGVSLLSVGQAVLVGVGCFGDVFGWHGWMGGVVLPVLGLCHDRGSGVFVLRYGS